jgi:uncharacterized protein YehS (DUF1456 family)
MLPNDVLRPLRYALKLTDSGLAELIALGGGKVTPLQVISYLKNEEEPGYAPCPDLVLAQCLNGLITQRRGARENAPAAEERLDNNLVLKKLRVAFELKEEDILSMMEKAGFGVSKPELSALFRKPDHKNYRPAGDQFLRNFLKGLSLKVRG